MYTVLIADDEAELRQAIIENVDWNRAGFEVVGGAENGVEALELVEELKPDLVLTDIRMPLMTGLELAAKIREVRPATNIVILSGYDDFQYARAAIQYNIISYLLKPISADEMFSELLKIKEKMDAKIEEIRQYGLRGTENIANRLKITEFLLPLLLGTNESSPNDRLLNRRAAELGMIDKSKPCSFAVAVSKYRLPDGTVCTDETHIGFSDAIMKKYIKAESFLVNGAVVTLAVIDGNDYMEQLRLPLTELVQRSEKILNQECTIGISRDVSALSQCGGAYFDAVTAHRYTTDGAGSIRFIADQERGEKREFDSIEKSLFTLEQLLKVGTKDDLTAFLSDFYSEKSRKGTDYMVIEILATVYRAVSAVSEKEAVSELLNSNSIYSKISFYDYEENIKSDLSNLCINAREIISRYQKHETEILCDKVLQIIEEDYSSETLSLTDVSTRLSISPNYLSALIKKTKKKNFVTLVTDKRMAVAKDLLICSKMKILEIAERCGYSDQHYFSYCFKKYYGVSPNKMRESARGDVI